MLTMKVCVLLGVFGSAVSLLFPGTIIKCFNSEEEILRVGVPALRYLMVLAPMIAYTITNSQLFQSIDLPWIAIVTSLSRQVIFLIPISFVKYEEPFEVEKGSRVSTVSFYMGMMKEKVYEFEIKN